MTWHRDGVKLRASRRCALTLDREGIITLEIKGATSADAGLYICTARNEVGETRSSTRVVVTSPGSRNGAIANSDICELPLVSSNQ